MSSHPSLLIDYLPFHPTTFSNDKRRIGPPSVKRIKVPNTGSRPATTRIGEYEKLSTTHPVVSVKRTAPAPAPTPPSPATDATACWGKKSLGILCTLFIQL